MRLTILLVWIMFAVSTCSKAEEVVEVDPCAEVICQNDATCVQGICECKDGYEGIFCEQAIYIPPCDTLNCLNRGRCVDDKCNCPLYYYGKRCEHYEAPWDCETP